MMSEKPYTIIEKTKTNEKGKLIEMSLEVSADLTKSEADELFNLIYKWFDKKYNRREKK